MTTMRQAVERQRTIGTLPLHGDIGLNDLFQRFGPIPGNSTRALLAAMSARAATRRPWAVILCRFKDEAGHPDPREAAIERFYRDAFRRGSGGLQEYWRDASLGAIAIDGSDVFGWVDVDLTRAQAGGKGRVFLCDLAVQCALRAGHPADSGFFGHIAVYIHNWSDDDPARPPGWPTWQPDDPLKPWWGSWIDGSAQDGRITLTPPHDGDITAHEMGHVLGMNHDVSADLKLHYADPCCVMSQKSASAPPGWSVNFGPALCLPHLVQQGWMYPQRLQEDTAWQRSSVAVGFPLAALVDPGADAPLGLKLHFSDHGSSWDYHVEYVRPTDWNRGIGVDTVFVRRIARADVGDTPSFLGKLVVPSVFGSEASFVEPIGNVSFRVRHLDQDGRRVMVTVLKL
jgi:hypothetical protein